MLGGARELKRRPLTPHPTPRSTARRLTDADHFRIMKQASVASLRWRSSSPRNPDRLQPGMLIGFAGIRTFYESVNQIQIDLDAYVNINNR
jgi:hypothetical protein